MADRRNVIRTVGLALLIAPVISHVRAAETVRRIGVLSPGPTLLPNQYQGVWIPLQELGWIEGRNILFERRWAEGRRERLQPLAEELVRLRVGVIVTIGTEATVAARNASRSIPIVMLSAADPVGAGLVATLARPGGNVTGISMVGPEMEVKRLALLREVLPNANRVGVLVSPATAVSGYSRSVSEAAFHSVGMQPVFIEVNSADDLDQSVAQIARRGAQALVVQRAVLFSLHGAEVMSAASRHRLPTIVEDKGMARAGGLISYSIDEADQLKRFATFVDRILRGAAPSQLPVEQPTKFELVVNLRSAEALGLTIPSSVLLRADEVIR